ncbi:RNA polymerase sigma factor [Chitinophaga nivalis]|uniref:Sigma-70 family RNA polymerase sigma factor n=1 Tax=Chitinophaga nivalis TaxID=2991709 RepID=A0ABT3IGI1_9BACT|nr:sigma-70 family RNA polymerase sigma factor [Chitinophaga nivalis]MCW3467244.1 sigma-70 family RNA polymerase sigma factor [Chitinophaga nivalis]MCW3483064.1 sigma-70 family RNA polymerase sigma factor [Chitinophaga nivalis]
MHTFQDDMLLQQLKAGDEAAFIAIYNRYQPMLLLEAYYKVRDYAEAEDMVQDIFTALWQRRETILVTTSLKNYLFKSVHYQYAAKLRKNDSSRKFLLQWLHQVENSSDERPIENKELGEQINDAIKNISAAATRKAFQMLYIDGKSQKEIAIDMNINLQVVKNQVSRALKTLRQQLRKAY